MAFFFFLLMAISLHADERSYWSKIKITNNSGYKGFFGIGGNNCWTWDPITNNDSNNSAEKKSVLLTALEIGTSVRNVTHRKYVPCQEVELQDGDSYTFYIDKANVFNSIDIFPRVDFSRYVGFTWYCLDKNENNRHIALSKWFMNSKPLNAHQSYDITFSAEHSKLSRGYYCDVKSGD